MLDIIVMVPHMILLNVVSDDLFLRLCISHYSNNYLYHTQWVIIHTCVSLFIYLPLLYLEGIEHE